MTMGTHNAKQLTLTFSHWYGAVWMFWFQHHCALPHLLTAISGPEPQSLEEPKGAERWKEWLTLFYVVALSVDIILVIDFIFKRYIKQWIILR